MVVLDIQLTFAVTLLKDMTDPRQVKSGYSNYFTYPVCGKLDRKA